MNGCACAPSPGYMNNIWAESSLRARVSGIQAQWWVAGRIGPERRGRLRHRWKCLPRYRGQVGR